MKSDRLHHFKNLILEKRREILEEEATFDSNKFGNDRGEEKYATHMADLGSDTMEKEQSSYLDERLEKYLKHLDDALERITEGTYGTCLECGKEIPEERLEAVPHTRYCVACKRQMV